MKYGDTKKEGKKPQLNTVLNKLYENAESQNIASNLDEKTLDELGSTVKRDYETDKSSRSEWEESAEKAMDVALQVREAKSFPFENASNIKYPLVTVAALQFGARAYPAIVDGKNIVKGTVVGSDEGVPQVGQDGQPMMQPGPNGEPLPVWQLEPGAKREQAERIGAHMSHQLLNEMEEWESDTDVLLHHLPIVGCAFRKVYYDAHLGRNRARMRPALNLVVNNNVDSLDNAQRVTDEIDLYPQDIEERVRVGDFVELDISPAEENDEDAAHEFLEQHRYIDLDEDGYREPYIVTIHKETNQVARIVANYKPDDIQHDGDIIIRIPKRQYFIKYSFLRDPKGGFYDIGFGKLLESLSGVIDSSLNQMLDAGTLQNAGGGFIGSGLRTKKSQIRMSPGKYLYVEASGQTIKDSIYNFEHPGPSPVLFNLLELLLAATKDITGVKDILTGDAGDKVQTATTTMAMVEQGLKVFTSIYKRVWTAMRAEYKLLFALNSEYLEEENYFNVLDDQQAVARSDYDSSTIDVIPVSDPSMVTDMQRSARAQFLLEIFEIIPNKEEALRRIFDMTREPNIDALMEAPEQSGPSPEELAFLAEQEAKSQELEASAATEQMKTEAQMQIEQMKAQTTAELQLQLGAIKAELENQKLMLEADKASANIELEVSKLNLEHHIAHLENELKCREHDSNAEIRREEIKSSEKTAQDAKKTNGEEKPQEKQEPVNVVLNVHEGSSKKITLDRGKDGKITGATSK